MNLTRSTRKSKMKQIAKLSQIRKKITLSVVSILSCLSLLFVGGVASTVNPEISIDNQITYTSDIAFEKNPNATEFYIRTYEDLQVLANLVNSNAKITGTDYHYADASYVVLNDITNTSDAEMNPIGSESSPFTGTFNGNGKEIKGVKISGSSYVGFFGNTLGASIENIVLDGGEINATGNNVGGLIGASTGTRIDKAWSSVEVKASSSSHVGGLVGSFVDSYITESANTANVTGGTNVGGLIGTARSNADASKIENCINAGNVNGTSNVAGLVGVMNGSSSEMLVYMASGYSVAKLPSHASTAIASSTNISVSSIYTLANMGGQQTTDTINMLGSDMSGISALDSGNMNGLDSSFFEPVENTTGVYNLPKLKNLGVGATLYQLSYDANDGDLPILNGPQFVYTTFYKKGDDIVLATPTRDGYVFQGWKEGENFVEASSFTGDNARSAELTAIWELVDPAVTLSSSATDNTITYGEDLTVNANYTRHNNINYSIEWKKDGVIQDYVTDSIVLSGLVPKDGGYEIEVKVTATASELTKTATAKITIYVNKKALIITPEVGDITYGSTVDEAKYKISVPTDGFVGEDSLTSGALTGTMTYSVYSADGVTRLGDETVIPTLLVGTYKMQLGGLSSDLYEITYEMMQFEVVKRSLTIMASNDSKVYDGTPLSNSTYNAYNLAAGDTLSSVTVSGSITDVGSVANRVTSYTIKKGETDVKNCYTVSLYDGTLSVMPMRLVLDVSATLNYGGTIPFIYIDYSNNIDWNLIEINFGSAIRQSLVFRYFNYTQVNGEIVIGSEITDISQLPVGTYLIQITSTSTNFSIEFENSTIVNNSVVGIGYLTVTETTTSYTITYIANGTIVSEEDLEQSYTIDDETITLATTTKEGYTSSWKVTTADGNWGIGETFASGASIPGGKYGNVILTAQPVVDPQTVTIQHYVMNTSGSYPSSANSSTSTTMDIGTTITLADFQDKNVNLEELNFLVPNGIVYASVTVGDTENYSSATTTVPAGGVTIKYYYSRYKHTLDVVAGTGIGSVAGGTSSAYYGGTYTITASVSDGYTWSKWTLLGGEAIIADLNEISTTITIGAMDNGSTIQVEASTTASTTAYKVYHYLENINVNATLTPSNCTLIATDNLTVTTGVEVTPTRNTYEGFTAPSAQTVIIAGDGLTEIYYYYSRNSYIVSATKGTGISNISITATSLADGKVDYGDSVTLEVTAFSMGYAWNTDSKWTDTSGTSVSTTNPYTFTMGTSAVSLTATATPTTYTIRCLDLDGEPTSITYTIEDTSVTLENIMPMTGRETGYYLLTSADNTTWGTVNSKTYASGETVTLNGHYGNIILTSQLGQYLTYTVTVTSSYGTWQNSDSSKSNYVDSNWTISNGNQTISRTATFNTVYSVPQPIVSTGYHFTGWTPGGTNYSAVRGSLGPYCGNSISCSTAWYNKATIGQSWNPLYFKNLSSTNNGAVTITAGDAVNSYVIIANANGGSLTTTTGWTIQTEEATATKSFDHGSAYSFPNITPETGYELKGWYTSATGGDLITNSDLVTGQTSIYAQWSPITVSYSFNFNFNSTMLDETGISDSGMEEILVPYGKTIQQGTIVGHSEELLPNITISEIVNGFDFEGYKFLGWQVGNHTGTISDYYYKNPDQAIDDLVSRDEFLNQYGTIDSLTSYTFNACYYELLPSTSTGILVQCPEDMIALSYRGGYITSSQPFVVTKDIVVDDVYTYRTLTSSDVLTRRFHKITDDGDTELTSFYMQSGSATFSNDGKTISSITKPTSFSNASSHKTVTFKSRLFVSLISYAETVSIQGIIFDFNSAVLVGNSVLIERTGSACTLSYVTVRNVKLSLSPSSGDSGIMVGWSNGVADITNCAVENSEIMGDTASVPIGGIVGRLDSSEVIKYDDNLVNRLIINITNSDGDPADGHIGGHIGYLNLSGNNHSITNNIVDETDITSGAMTSIGGFAGHASSDSGAFYIRNCSITNVTIDGSEVTYTGGVVGATHSSVVLSDNHVKDSKITGANNVGGIAGLASNLITNSNNSSTSVPGINLFDFEEFAWASVASSEGKDDGGGDGDCYPNHFIAEGDHIEGYINGRNGCYGGAIIFVGYGHLYDRGQGNTLYIDKSQATTTNYQKSAYLVPVAPDETYTLSWWGTTDDFENYDSAVVSASVYEWSSLTSMNAVIHSGGNTSSSVQERTTLSFRTSSTARYVSFSFEDSVNAGCGVLVYDILLNEGINTDYNNTVDARYSVEETIVTGTGRNVGGIVGETSSSIMGVSTNNVDVKGAYSVGGIAGKSTRTAGSTMTDPERYVNEYSTVGSAFQNCVVTGGSVFATSRATGSTLSSSITVGASYSYSAVGGIVGFNAGGGAIIGCESGASVTSNGYGNGGIVGVMTDGNTIYYCKNTGAIRSNNGGNADVVGGIVGLFHTTGNTTVNIAFSTNHGSVFAIGSAVGGIVGWIAGSATAMGNRIYACQNVGSVTGSNGSSYVGGIVGRIGLSENVLSYFSVLKCINNGTVNGGSTGIGGIIGYNYGSSSRVNECINTGHVKSSGISQAIIGATSSTMTTTNLRYLTNSAASATNGGTNLSPYEIYQLATTDFDNNSWDPMVGFFYSANGKQEAYRPDTFFCPRIQGANGSSYIELFELSGSEYDIFTKVYDSAGTTFLGYAITNIDHLVLLHNAIVGNGVITTNGEGTPYAECNYYVLNNITTALTNPIGSEYRPFKGAFYGATATLYGSIYKLSSTTPSTKPTIALDILKSAYDYVGLFAKTNGATISYIKTVGSVQATENVGGIVGYAYDTIFSNCENAATITVTYNGGGIAGSYSGTLPTDGDSVTFNVSDVTNTGEIKIRAVTGYSHDVGGIFGDASGLKLNNATNSGSIYGTGTIGGIVGSFGSGTISSSNNSGTIYGENSVGGIAGFVGTKANSKEITSSKNTGTITSTGKHTIPGTSGIGGIAGSIAYDTLIQSNINEGTILVSYKTFSVGGIVGRHESTNDIKGNKNQANVTANTSYYVGGIVGNSFGTGSIHGNSLVSGTISGFDCVGGLVGYMSRGALYKGSLPTGIHEPTNAGASVSGATNVGGFVGSLSGSATIGFKLQYLAGYGTQVSGHETNDFINKAPVSGNMNVGGIVGKISDISKTNYDANEIAYQNPLAIAYVRNEASVSCKGESSYNSTLGYNITWTTAAQSYQNLIDTMNKPSTTVLAAGNYQANIGGVVGLMRGGTIEAADNSGSVLLTGTSNVSLTTDVDRTYVLGGLISVNSWTANINSGAMTGFGGIVGRAENGARILGSWVGRTTNSSCAIGVSTSQFTNSHGATMVGGIVGYLKDDSFIGQSTFTASGSSAVASRDRTQTAVINGTVTLRGAYFTGGSVGYADGSSSQGTPYTLVGIDWTLGIIKKVEIASGVYKYGIDVNYADGSRVNIYYKNNLLDQTSYDDIPNLTENLRYWAGVTNSLRNGVGVFANRVNSCAANRYIVVYCQTITMSTISKRNEFLDSLNELGAEGHNIP